MEESRIKMRQWPMGKLYESQTSGHLSTGPNYRKTGAKQGHWQRRQQAVKSDGLVLVEAMHTHLKRRKLDYRNWLPFCRKKLQKPGGGKMSAIWRNCRKENWKSCRSGVGKWERSEAIWQGFFGWGQTP
jgi:hypothetical protein